MFALTIDLFYGIKHEICKEWDRALNVAPTEPHSAVLALNLFYEARRPYFEFADHLFRF